MTATLETVYANSKVSNYSDVAAQQLKLTDARTCQTHQIYVKKFCQTV